MIKTIKTYILLLLAVGTFMACSDDDDFTTSADSRLTFPVDTLELDTVFSNVPGAMKSFWIYNHSGHGLRFSDIRLLNGEKSGFRVNVDGIDLSEGKGASINEISLRKGDSLKVMVEITAPLNKQDGPQLDEDNLAFTLESGITQTVNLKAYSWNATLLKDVHIVKDSIIGPSEKPLVIYGGITVDSAATLTLAPGTTLYFHPDAGINVYGRLLSMGTSNQNVTLRGDRIDRMFDYLPYDNIPAQWKGLHFYSSSYGNELQYTDVHSTRDGILVDSSDVSKLKLLVANSTIHNCQGFGLYAANSQLLLNNVELSNALHDCFHVDGGRIRMNHCTLAQFYPFDSHRGAAIGFTATYPLENLDVYNSIITGYADDQVERIPGSSTVAFNYAFNHCIIRTPRVITADSVHFVQVIYEDIKDTTSQGEKHFVKVDAEHQSYNFALDSASVAIGKAEPQLALPTDRNGIKRDDAPDIGAYEYVKVRQ